MLLAATLAALLLLESVEGSAFGHHSLVETKSTIMITHVLYVHGVLLVNIGCPRVIDVYQINLRKCCHTQPDVHTPHQG